VRAAKVTNAIPISLFVMLRSKRIFYACFEIMLPITTSTFSVCDIHGIRRVIGLDRLVEDIENYYIGLLVTRYGLLIHDT